MINTIIFDLSDVLINGLTGSEKYLKKFNKSIAVTDFYIKQIDDFFVGKISEEEYWQAVVKKHQWEVSIDILKKAVRDNFKEIRGTRAIIQTLKTKKYKLGLLSIHTKEWVEYCEEKYKYHNLFDSMSYSYQALIAKPDKKAFEIILRSLKSKAEETIFIDDNLTNVNVAKQIGMIGIQFNSPSQLKKELMKLDILN